MTENTRDSNSPPSLSMRSVDAAGAWCDAYQIVSDRLVGHPWAVSEKPKDVELRLKAADVALQLVLSR